MKRTATLSLILFSLCCLGSAVLAQSAPTTRGMNDIVYPPVSMQMSCNEMVAQYVVRADAARRIVPQAYTLKLDENGNATLMMPVQECSDLQDTEYGLHTGTAGLAHAWIAIQPPADAPVPEPLPDMFNLPTMYWYYLQGQTDNEVLAFRMALSGIQVQLIDSVSLGGYGPGARQGQVVEHENPIPVTYSWQETSTADITPFPPLFGVRHVLYRKQTGVAGPTLFTGEVRCALSLYGTGSSTLTADRLSTINKLGLGAELYSPVTLDFDQGCTFQFHVQSWK